jgi:hypothetical protein
VGGLKPVWTVLPQYESKLPTEQELRCMAYLAITSGANGIGIYSWDERTPKTPQGWHVTEHADDLKILSTVIGELAAHQDILMIPNTPDAVTFSPANPALHAALKESAQGKYLIVINDSRKAEEGTLSIQGIQSADGIDLLNANNKIAIRDGKLNINLPPIGTALFQLSNVKGGGG